MPRQRGRRRPLNAALEFGRINVPTNNPRLCQRCKRKHTLDEHTKPVH